MYWLKSYCKKPATINIRPRSKVVSYDDIAAFSMPGSGRNYCARDADDNLYGGIR